MSKNIYLNSKKCISLTPPPFFCGVKLKIKEIFNKDEAMNMF